MILFPSSFVLSAAASAYPLTYPRIGYQTYGFDLLPSAITVSGDTTDGPKDAPLRPDTAEYWEADVLPATWIADLGAASDLDYVGIAGHTIGSSGAAVEVRTSNDLEFWDYMTVPGVAGNYASTPDSVGNSVTGDLDVRIKLAATDWTPSAERYVFTKGDHSNDRSWSLGIDTAGKLVLYVSSNGTSWLDGTGHTSSVATGVTDGSVKYIRATRVSATGVITYYTSDDAVTWTPLGTTVASTSGALFNATGLLRVIGPGELFVGNVYSAELRNGIGGTVVASFTAEDAVTDDDTTITSSATAEVWTINRSGIAPPTLVLHTFSTAVAPANDSPLMFLDDLRTARYLKITLTGSTVPRIAVVYMGVALAMERKNVGPFTPLNLSRQTVLQRSLSRSGQFLGQGFRRNGVMGSAAFVHLDPTWYRENFDPFVEHARRYPYFFAWCPEEQPEEVGYVWTDKDIAGVYMGDPQWMQVQWAMSGIGNG